MRDAVDIRITTGDNVVYASQAYLDSNNLKSRVGIPKGQIVDFYCPECHSPVFLKKRKGAEPWFEHEHLPRNVRDDMQLKCSRYTNSDRKKYQPIDTYRVSGAIPLYLLGKTGIFKLRAYFPQLSSQSMERLMKKNARVVIRQKGYIREYKAQYLNFCDIDTYTEAKFNVAIKDINGKTITDLPEEVKRKWCCGICAIDESRDIFHSWKDGGMRVAKGGFVYIGTTYRVLKRDTYWKKGYDIKGIKSKKVGEVHFKNTTFLNVYELMPTELTDDTIMFFAKCGYILKNRSDEIIPLWPPAIYKGNQLIYKDNDALFFHKTHGQNINKHKVYILEGNRVEEVLPYNLNKINETSEIVKINVGVSKPIMLDGKLTPMYYDILKDEKDFNFEPIPLKLKITDKNQQPISHYSEKPPLDGKIYIKTNLPSMTYLKIGNFILFSSFSSEHLKGVKLGLDVIIDCGAWGRYCFSFKKPGDTSYEIEWESFYKKILLCKGKRVEVNSRRMLRLMDAIEKNKDNNSIPFLLLSKKWVLKDRIPISAKHILVELEKDLFSQRSIPVMK
jgi:hypothetical protein